MGAHWFPQAASTRIRDCQLTACVICSCRRPKISGSHPSRSPPLARTETADTKTTGYCYSCSPLLLLNPDHTSAKCAQQWKRWCWQSTIAQFNTTFIMGMGSAMAKMKSYYYFTIPKLWLKRKWRLFPRQIFWNRVFSKYQWHPMTPIFAGGPKAMNWSDWFEIPPPNPQLLVNNFVRLWRWPLPQTKSFSTWLSPTEWIDHILSALNIIEASDLLCLAFHPGAGGSLASATPCRKFSWIQNFWNLVIYLWIEKISIQIYYPHMICGWGRFMLISSLFIYPDKSA